jgi:hypothetical protein
MVCDQVWGSDNELQKNLQKKFPIKKSKGDLKLSRSGNRHDWLKWTRQLSVLDNWIILRSATQTTCKSVISEQIKL